MMRAGCHYWIQFNIHPMFDKAGAYVGYVSIETVITERKALEGEIESRNAYLSGIIARQRLGHRRDDGSGRCDLCQCRGANTCWA